MTSFSQWRKSSHSSIEGVECVEVSIGDNAVGIRDSRNPHGGVLVVDHAEWRAFLDGIAWDGREGAPVQGRR